MSERTKVILYTLVASALLFVGVQQFLGSTEEYASRLDIRNTARDPNWDPENEVINERAPINPSTVVRAEVNPNDSVGGGTPVSPMTKSIGDPGEEEELPDHGDEGERLTVADVERPDSDGDMAAGVVVDGMSPEEAALLERIDPELLTGRPTTRALDLMLTECTVRVSGTSASDSADAADSGDPADEEGQDDDVLRRPDVLVGVRFRHASVAIKGSSLNRVDAMINLFNTSVIY